MKKVIFNLLFVLLSTLAVAGGNKSSLMIKGKVMDDEGNPAVGAKVILVDSDREVYTDFNGVFTFEGINANQKKIKVNYISHQELISEVSTTASQNQVITLSLTSK